MIAEDKVVDFMDDVSASGGPLEVPIPLTVDRVCVRLIVRKDNASTVVGMQFVVGAKDVHTQQFRSPLTLIDNQISGITLAMRQVVGIPENDMK